MSLRSTLPAAPLAFAFLAAAFSQQPGSVVGWFNGEWQSGVPGLSNWYAAPDDFARVYDPFEVPDRGWTVIAVFSNGALRNFPRVMNASWEIRRGMVPGNGGEVVASGVSRATQLADPAVTSPKYPASEASEHFRIEVNGLHIQLPPGRYWLSVTPIGRGDAYASATLRANAVTSVQEGIGAALFDRPGGPRFVLAEAAGSEGQKGIARHFSQGVIVAQ
jgi:hypothetical protein